MLRRVWTTIVAILRELSDESAYARHLKRCGRPHSGEEWRRFYEHRLAGKYQQAKCC